MKRYINVIVTIALMLTFGNVSGKANANFDDEVLNYQVVYHWGLIWKHAANAQLSLRSVGNNYNAVLCARTVSWADKVYKVRDTLTCTMKKDGLLPQKYVKTSHEGNYYAKDIVDYEYQGNTIVGKCTRIRKNSQRQNSTLQSTGSTYDMLSVFYYLRVLDFDELKHNKVYKTTMFSGKEKEMLYIKYVGVETIKLRDKTQCKAYHLKFSFTQEGQGKSSDDIDAWVSFDARRIPLMLRGKLPIGEVRVYYAGK